MGEVERAPLLRGLVSDSAAQLYERILQEGCVAVGSGPSAVDPHDPALDELLRKQIVRPTDKLATHVTPMPRHIALHLATEAAEHQLETHHEEIVRLWSTLRAQVSRWPLDRLNGPRSAGIELLTDSARIKAISQQIYVAARVEVCDFTIPRWKTRDPDLLTVILPRPSALAAGVRYRMVYDHSFLRTERGRADLLYAAHAGEDIRIRKNLPTKLRYRDDTEALVALTPTGTDGALHITSPELLAVVRQLFELIWNDSQTLPLHRTGLVGPSESTPPDNDALPGDLFGSDSSENNAVRRKLASLMVSGATDEGMARALGVSVRTVERMISAMMAELGVPTRFAAGVAIARRGLV